MALAGRERANAQFGPILAALVDLVRRQILGLHLVVSFFHRGHVFEVRHRVFVSGQRLNSKQRRSWFIISVTETVADAFAVHDVLHQDARFVALQNRCEHTLIRRESFD